MSSRRKVANASPTQHAFANLRYRWSIRHCRRHSLTTTAMTDSNLAL